ncbi:hypothetical protein [Saccharibacillus sp. JS10]|uniref:hypothetical protein n=1 Tax=Saccharibacillus sp. JS10 TaxID=2950552 RepID=UPI00210E6342|nr:hypothetical protein [Saccharibacillus sp. JS10]MCQ4087660.1 hypothetical protein [Saccharibacillus sp. JS10]
MNDSKLSGIEVFAFDVRVDAEDQQSRRLIRRYGLLKLSCGTAAGYSVCLISEDVAPADLVRWSACLVRLRGLTLESADSVSGFQRLHERHAAQCALLRRALANLREALEARHASARLLLGLGAAGILSGFAARSSVRGSDVPHPPVRYAPDAVLRQRKLAAKIQGPSSSALMDRADAYYSIF